MGDEKADSRAHLLGSARQMKLSDPKTIAHIRHPRVEKA